MAVAVPAVSCRTVGCYERDRMASEAMNSLQSGAKMKKQACRKSSVAKGTEQ